MAGLLQAEKQLFEKFWRGTFKAVAMPRPGSVIVASITARRPVAKLEETRVASGVTVESENSKTCERRRDTEQRKHQKNSQNQPEDQRVSLDSDLPARPAADTKRKKKKSQRKRKRNRSPSFSPSPVRKRKKKKRKKSKRKRHSSASGKRRRSGSSSRHKRKKVKKHKKRSEECPRSAVPDGGPAASECCCRRSTSTICCSSPARPSPPCKSRKRADYDSGNDTSSPPSSKAGLSERGKASGPGKVRDTASDSGNSLSSYDSLSKPLLLHKNTGEDRGRSSGLEKRRSVDVLTDKKRGSWRERSRSRSWWSHSSSSWSSRRSSSRSSRSSSLDSSRSSSHRRSGRRKRGRRASSMRKRRRDSPSHLEARRITSARKRPVPYHRPSPSLSSRSSSAWRLFSLSPRASSSSCSSRDSLYGWRSRERR